MFQKPQPAPNLDPVALVILQTQPQVLSRAHVTHAVGQALGRSFPESEVTEEDFSFYRLWVEGFEFTIASRPEPYVPKENAVTADIRLNDVILRHEAAVLVDCWAAPPGISRESSTDLMGKIVHALLDETSLAVFAFHTQRLNPLDDTLREMLAEGRASEAMAMATADAVIGVHNADELMNAAIEEARARWPEFVAAFRAHGRDTRAIVKAKFGEGDDAEHMWFEVHAADETGAEGVLQSQPYFLPRPRQGDPVRVPVEDVSDWIAVVNEELRGNFSDAAIRAAQRAGAPQPR